MAEATMGELRAALGEILLSAAEALHDEGVEAFSGDPLADALVGIKDCAQSVLQHANVADTSRLAAAAPKLFAVVQFLLSIERDLRQPLCQCDDTYCASCSWLNEAQWAVNKALGLPCAVCDGVGVVSTTRIDQDGEHVEIACPVCHRELAALQARRQALLQGRAAPWPRRLTLYAYCDKGRNWAGEALGLTGEALKLFGHFEEVALGVEVGEDGTVTVLTCNGHAVVPSARRWAPPAASDHHAP